MSAAYLRVFARVTGPWLALVFIITQSAWAEDAAQSSALRDELKACKFKIVYETCRDANWELFRIDADGSNPVNLTRTLGVDEMYPKASPDGTKICFVADEGRGKDRDRSVYCMNADGSDRFEVAHHARQPCWSPDGKTIAYLKGRPGPYTTDHAATRGLFFYDLATKKHTPHVNGDIERVLCISWSPDRNWFVATAAGGMGYGFAIIAFQADGLRHGELLASKKASWQCRPDFSPDGKKIAYAKAVGESGPDKLFAIEVAGIDLSGTAPKLTDRQHVVTASWPTELYHADWSPDGKYIAFSRGPREMNRMKPQRAIVGIQAPGWNICVARAGDTNVWVALTADGMSNKEPDWVLAK
jgi:TolB protein